MGEKRQKEERPRKTPLCRFCGVRLLVGFVFSFNLRSVSKISLNSTVKKTTTIDARASPCVLRVFHSVAASLSLLSLMSRPVLIFVGLCPHQGAKK